MPYRLFYIFYCFDRSETLRTSTPSYRHLFPADVFSDSSTELSGNDSFIDDTGGSDSASDFTRGSRPRAVKWW